MLRAFLFEMIYKISYLIDRLITFLKNLMEDYSFINDD